MHQPFVDSWACKDCCVDLFDAVHEYYMVHDSVWRKAKMRARGGMLCVDCLESRIGRKLSSRDFTPAPINTLDFAHPFYFPKSSRLITRLLSPG